MNGRGADERSRRVGQAIDRTTVRAFPADARRVVELFDACAASLTTENFDDLERVEVARRIAEAKVAVLFEREGAITEFLESWEALQALGFSSLERKLSMLVHFMLFADRTYGRDSPETRGALDRMERLTDLLAESGSDAIAEHFREVHARISSA